MTEKQRQYFWGIGGSVALHLLVILILLVMTVVARRRPKPEVLVVDLVAYAPPSAPVEDPPAPQPLQNKEEPALPPPPPPKEEPAVSVPKPKEKPPTEKPKPKKPTLQERLESARKQQPKKVETPQPPREDPRRRDALKRLEAMERRLQNVQQNDRGGSSIPNVPLSQMSRYEAYNQRCVMPMLDREWQRFGPNGLERPPNDAVVTFTVAPDGRITGCVVSQESESAAMNRAAEALCRELTQRRLPAFSTVNLITDHGAALVFTYHLRYARK